MCVSVSCGVLLFPCPPKVSLNHASALSAVRLGAHSSLSFAHGSQPHTIDGDVDMDTDAALWLQNGVKGPRARLYFFYCLGFSSLLLVISPGGSGSGSGSGSNSNSGSRINAHLCCVLLLTDADA